VSALLLLTGPQAGRRHEVTGEVIIGRSPSCTISLEDAKVSRRHVRLVLEDGQARVSDLGSRNGTVVNGEKIEAEMVLLPGDRLQVGDSTILFEPSARASLSDREASKEVSGLPVEELLPAAGPVAGLYHAGVALLSATSEAMVLRRAAEELSRGVNSDKAAALLGGTEGLLTAAVVGAEKVEVPRSMVRAALERKEASLAGGVLVAPLIASGGAPFGILYAERPEDFGAEEQRTITALGRLAGEACTALRAQEDPSHQVHLIGSSRQFRKTVEQARRAASAAETVVVWGEFGTGRLQMAEYIHSRSPRALAPFVVVDCREHPTAVEEQLFGRTSAPGVPPASSALFEADGGTFVLRAIEALPRHASDRLARLVSRRVAPSRQGGEEPVDVRVMVTCDAPLQTLVSRGELDAELARVLAGTEIETLPLRDRRPDVLQLFEHFAAEAARARRKEPPQLTPDARRVLVDYHWPLNVEELRGVTERLALLYAGAEVSALVLPPEVQQGATEGQLTLAQRVQRLERDAIAEALRAARGKKIKAAAILGISRPTLDKKIEDYQLVVEKRRG
jgi:DNA-binding NtrC family response regulator/pSer/pThr/pTyr-binding forkhead associated (FHA) protein